MLQNPCAFKEFHNKQKYFEFKYSFVKEIIASSESQSAIPNVNKVLHIINAILLFRMIHLLKTLLVSWLFYP